MNTKVYDVEVLRGPQETPGGWNNPWGMGFGTAVVYDYNEDRYDLYGPQDREKLIGDLARCRVISFNGIKFDNNVILSQSDRAAGFHTWQDVDLLLQVVMSKYGLPDVATAEKKLGDKEVHDGSIGLDGLAEGTLGLHKTGHGAKAPDLIRNSKWAEVYAYNLNDVRVCPKV